MTVRLQDMKNFYRFKIGRFVMLRPEDKPMDSKMRIIKIVFNYQLEGEEHWYNNQAHVPLDGEDTQVAISALRDCWLGREIGVGNDQKKKVTGFRLYQALVMAEADCNPYPTAITD